MSGSNSCEPTLFQEVLVCLPFDRYKNPKLESGNKIVMPSSSLSRLERLSLKCPWFFKMESFNSDKVSHCSVLEFGAEEGFAYMPRWMMENLGVEDGDEVILRHAQPSRGMSVKLRPHKAAFVEVSNVKAMLETALRGFSCLSSGDTIMVMYNGEAFHIDVLDVGPVGGVISLIETDCVVKFAPPLDYVEPPLRDGGEEEREGWKEFRVLMRLDGEVKGKRREEGVREFRPFAGMGMNAGFLVFVPSSAGAAAEAANYDAIGGFL